MREVVNFRRLLAGLAVLGALMVPLYFLLLQPPTQRDATLRSATLLKTPASKSASKVGLEVGLLAPDFEISTTEGRRVRLSDFRGRPLVLNFFALWCGSCLVEMPELKAAQEERGIDSFAVLAVNAGETRERALEWVEFLDAPFTYGLDFNLAVSDAYGVRGLPATVFIDSQGVIQTVYVGYTGKERLTIFLDAAIKAQPPGELPVVLRLVSAIPRDRVLTVEAKSERELKLSSRSLRCDASYCAAEIVRRVEALPGVSKVKADLASTEPTLTVRYDPDAVTQQQIVDVTAGALESLPDPVYEGPVQVAFAGS
jgi:peroxiredoxin/copper chaperone CopZ